MYDFNIVDINKLDPLTHAEAKVAILISEGLTSKRISEILGVKPRTLEHHMTSCRTKIGIPINSDYFPRLQIAFWVLFRLDKYIPDTHQHNYITIHQCSECKKVKVS